MWEQIRANKRKSMVLVFVMAILLMTLGFVIGTALLPIHDMEDQLYPLSHPARYVGGFFGFFLAGCIWFVMSLTAYFAGGKIMLAASGAKKIEKQDHPKLFNVVEEMCIAAGMSKMPDIYIIDDMALNAFATGRSPDKSAIAITAGLLGKLNRDELQGVIAHEMSHIINRDVLFMTMLGVMVGSIVIISDMFIRSLWFGGGRRRSRNTSREGGQAQMVLMIVAIVFAILSPILAQVIFFAASRKREYLADANGALLTRYPEGLASALEVIAHSSTELASVSKATAPMYISNPFRGKKLSALGSTHPPIESRVSILRSIGGNVSFGAYQQAWSRVGGKDVGSLPASALSDKRQLKARAASPESKKDSRQQMRQATDALRKINDFLFLSCVCGLQLKLPPNFKHDKLKCPRCHKDVAVPVAQIAAIKQVADTLDEKAEQQPQATKSASESKVVRKGSGWMSFKCTCGAAVTISPSFAGQYAKCSKCNRKTRVHSEQ